MLQNLYIDHEYQCLQTLIWEKRLGLRPDESQIPNTNILK